MSTGCARYMQLMHVTALLSATALYKTSAQARVAAGVHEAAWPLNVGLQLSGQLTGPQGSCTSIIASPLQAQPDSGAKALFNRDFEKGVLEKYVAAEPKRVLCLFGPRNVGKSALLRWLVTKGPLKDQALLYDCRELDAGTPVGFATTALRQVSLPAGLTQPGTLSDTITTAIRREGERRSIKPEQLIELVGPV